MIPDSRTATAPGWRSSGTHSVIVRLVRVFEPNGEPPEAIDLSLDRLEIGREPESGLKLPDETASRRHAEILFRGRDETFEVRDMGSKNGTWVDGQRVERAELKPNALLRIGGHLFVFEQLRLPHQLGLHAPADVALSRAWVEFQVDRAAESDLSLMIFGPTGAGKELLARRAHEASQRPGAFVAVNCATLNRELLGSELFGHTKGAFSDARTERKGLIASAQGGTLFLDEIADLPTDQQPALLRVLQEKRLRPVGSDREIDVDVRVVSATHRILDAESPHFRADLYGRLAGLVVELPGLADRRVEVLPLLRQLSPARFSLETAQCLLLHSWPLNVRELQHLAKKWELFGTETVDPSMLPESFRKKTKPESVEPIAEDRARPETGERPGREELESLLTQEQGKVAEVARRVGLSRQSLYRRLEEVDLNPADYRPGRRGG